jgi:ligand-binding SRPBCC domain-containing protein
MTGHYRVFEAVSSFNTTIQQMTDLHARIGPAQLTPPPIFVTVQQDTRSSLTEGDLYFTLWFLFLPVRWHARHEPGPTPTSFADVMVSGPMRYWRHEHIFEPANDGVRLIDRITLAHQGGLKGLMTRLFFDGLPLRMLFWFRHLKTRWLLRTL